jgi:hypothetical protein
MMGHFNNLAQGALQRLKDAVQHGKALPTEERRML